MTESEIGIKGSHGFPNVIKIDSTKVLSDVSRHRIRLSRVLLFMLLRPSKCLLSTCLNLALLPVHVC